MASKKLNVNDIDKLMETIGTHRINNSEEGKKAYKQFFEDEIKHKKELLALDKQLNDSSTQLTQFEKERIELKKIEIDLLIKQDALTTALLFTKNAAENGRIVAELKKVEELIIDVTKNLNENEIATKRNVEAVKEWESKLKDIHKISSEIWNKGVEIFKEVAKTDDELRKSAVSIGLNASQYEEFAKSSWKASVNTLSIGVNASDLAKIQQGYNSSLGTTLLLTSEQQEKIGYLIKGTTLGSEGVQKMAVGMGKVGVNTDEAYKLTEKLLNKAQDYGISADKATTTLLNNIGLAQSYNFSEGLDGLTKMAIQSSLLSINMNSVANMSEKLFNVQGAVEMSAKLNVLGGQFSQIGDWSQLMFNAREDITELQDMVARSLSDTAFYDIEKKMFTISSMNRQRLRSAADALGISVKELEESTLKQAQIQEVGSKINFSVDDESRAMIAMMAQNDSGVWKINIGDDLIAVSELTNNQIQSIKQQSIAIEEQAKLATGFQTAWNSMKLSFQASLAPIITEMIPVVKNLIENARGIVVTFGNFISTVGTFLGPGGVLGIFALIKGISFITQGKIFGEIAGSIISQKVTTALHGVMGKPITGQTQTNTPMSLGKRTAIASGIGVAGMAIGGGLNVLADNTEDEEKARGLGTLGGVIGGASSGAAIGTMILPGWGTAIGAVLGGTIGGVTSYNQRTPNTTQSINDGIITVKDGNTTVTPINSRDDINIIANKSDGVIANTRTETNNNNNTNFTSGSIQLSPLEIRGDINLKLSGNDIKGMSDNLIKNNEFIQILTKLIHEETRKISNNGSLRPSTLYV
jgi:hypothetical protein